MKEVSSAKQNIDLCTNPESTNESVVKAKRGGGGQISSQLRFKCVKTRDAQTAA